MFLYLKKFLFDVLRRINKLKTWEVVMIFCVGVQLLRACCGDKSSFLVLFAFLTLLTIIFGTLVSSKIYKKKIESVNKNIDDTFVILKNKKLLENKIKNNKNLKCSKNKYL